MRRTDLVWWSRPACYLPLALLPVLLSGCYEATRSEKDASVTWITNREQIRAALFSRTALFVEGVAVKRLNVLFNGDVLSRVDYDLDAASPADAEKLNVGMACAIAPGDLYVTAAHCLEHPPFSLLRVSPDKSTHILHPSVIWRDDARDIAILYAPGDETAPVFPVAQAPPTPGEPVVTLGNLWEFSAGLILPPWEGDSPLDIRHGIPTRRGDSGGPIMNRDGQLYGVVTGAQWRWPWFWIGTGRGARITSEDIAVARKLIPLQAPQDHGTAEPKP